MFCVGNGISLSTTLEVVLVENEPTTVLKFDGWTFTLNDFASGGRELSKLPSINSFGKPIDDGNDILL